MPQAKQTGEFNTFVGGLVTEASPLTFPENASLDEVNFILNRDGSRQRRLGMDRESGLTPYSLSYSVSPVGDVVVSAFEWKDVAGIASKTFIACQVHDKLYIMDRTDETLVSSSYVKTSIQLLSIQQQKRATFAAIDGKLVVAYGATTVKVITYDTSDDSFSSEELSIKVRDLFGVWDKTSLGTADEKNLFSPEYINYRPPVADVYDNHFYNLRNQGWGIPRLDWTGNSKVDPIKSFIDAGGANRDLPSNADTPVLAIYANVDETDKNSERFNDTAAARQEPAKSRTALGHYVIDLLDRGQSREAEYHRTTNTTTGIYANANPDQTPTYVSFSRPTVSLPTDKSEGGVNIITEFAGRVWYAGFSSEVTDGDSQSPSLSSYVFYSQQVEHEYQIERCYQEGDPTDIEAPDRLDTDGGFIRLSGAYNIQAMVNIGSGLMVLAENGVWLVSGSDSGSFNANNQTVTKITEHGTLAPGSVVLMDSTLMYWSDDAIYHITPNQFNQYVAKELSVNIRDFYQTITDSVKVGAQGIYDSYEKRVRWIYNSTPDTATTSELIFDVVLSAFSPVIINSLGTSQIPVAPVQVSPFSYANIDLGVLVGADDVLSDLDSVVVDTAITLGGFRETLYITLINSEDANNTSFTFSGYTNPNFKDWESVDSVGVDAAAYMLTGYISTGDYHRFKQVPYIYFHLLRTEDGYIVDPNNANDFLPVNASSCLVQSQWDWSNSPNSGKWGREFQAYRYKRQYFPVDVNDTYDSGNRTIVSKNKLRGRGRVVSLLISTEEGKDLKLLGWSMQIGTNQDV